MRRAMNVILATGFALVNVGCIAAVGNREIEGCRRQAVALDGQIYIVDLDDYRVRKIDAAAVDRAKTISYTEIQAGKE